MSFSIAESAGRPLSVAIIGVGGLLHAGLLVAPVLIAGQYRQAIQDPCLIVFLMLITWWYLLEASRGSLRRCESESGEGPFWLVPAIPVLMLVLFQVGCLGPSTAPRSVSVSTVIGALLMSVGILLRYLAICQLGKWFLDSISLVAGQPLITGGIYSLVRHPAESGFLTLAAGAAIVLQSNLAMLVWFLVVPLVVWRIVLEDRLLAQQFPEEFSRYVRSVPAFIPRRVLRFPGFD